MRRKKWKIVYHLCGTTLKYSWIVSIVLRQRQICGKGKILLLQIFTAHALLCRYITTIYNGENKRNIFLEDTMCCFVVHVVRCCYVSRARRILVWDSATQ